MKTAIVHDWLNGMRGGEKVLDALVELYPEAPIYTLFCERVKIAGTPFEGKAIVTSWLDRVPGVYRWYRNLLPLFPSAAESLDLSGFGLVLSSSHAVAKSVRAPDGIHICYCHTPMRYLWEADGGSAARAHERAGLAAVRKRMQEWDRESSARVDHFIANSGFVRDRIRRYYDRDATVIYPPVDVRFFTPSNDVPRGGFYLAAGALVSYKRFDVILDAFRRLRRRLLVAGVGPESNRLRSLAASNVEFVGRVDDLELRRLYRAARGFVFAGRDDFGIMPVEARACGCPVIAFGSGGALETVQEDVSGVFFGAQEPEAVVEAVLRLEGRSWPTDGVRSGVELFSRERFTQQIRHFIEGRTKA